jgi:hypothetical protein
MCRDARLDPQDLIGEAGATRTEVLFAFWFGHEGCLGWDAARLIARRRPQWNFDRG